MRICELHNKQVINTCDCKILGCVADVEFNECTGCIQSLIVPGPGKLFCLFGREIEYVIPFSCVRCIGPDAISLRKPYKPFSFRRRKRILERLRLGSSYKTCWGRNINPFLWKICRPLFWVAISTLR